MRGRKSYISVTDDQINNVKGYIMEGMTLNDAVRKAGVLIHNWQRLVSKKTRDEVMSLSKRRMRRLNKEESQKINLESPVVDKEITIKTPTVSYNDPIQGAAAEEMKRTMLGKRYLYSEEDFARVAQILNKVSENTLKPFKDLSDQSRVRQVLSEVVDSLGKEGFSEVMQKGLDSLLDKGIILRKDAGAYEILLISLESLIKRINH